MKIPKQVKIGGFIWEIIENADVSREGDNFASTHYRGQKIFIDPREPQQNKDKAFIHEILHAVIWQTGLNERLKRVEKDLTEEELETEISFEKQRILDNKAYLSVWTKEYKAGYIDGLKQAVEILKNN